VLLASEAREAARAALSAKLASVELRRWACGGGGAPAAGQTRPKPGVSGAGGGRAAERGALPAGAGPAGAMAGGRPRAAPMQLAAARAKDRAGAPGPMQAIGWTADD
jgi:hypothetical protein